MNKTKYKYSKGRRSNADRIESNREWMRVKMMILGSVIHLEIFSFVLIQRRIVVDSTYSDILPSPLFSLLAHLNAPWKLTQWNITATLLYLCLSVRFCFFLAVQNVHIHYTQSMIYLCYGGLDNKQHCTMEYNNMAFKMSRMRVQLVLLKALARCCCNCCCSCCCCGYRKFWIFFHMHIVNPKGKMF